MCVGGGGGFKRSRFGVRGSQVVEDKRYTAAGKCHYPPLLVVHINRASPPEGYCIDVLCTCTMCTQRTLYSYNRMNPRYVHLRP